MRPSCIIANLILVSGILAAGGILVFGGFQSQGSTNLASSLQWTQNTGAGISVPACGSSTACGGSGQNVVCTTCSGGAPSVEFTWADAGNTEGLTCQTVRIGRWLVGQDVSTAVRIAGSLPCSGNFTWTGGTNSTSYNYQVRYHTATLTSCTGGYDKWGTCQGLTTETRTYPRVETTCTGGYDKWGTCQGLTTTTNSGHLINAGSFSTPNCVPALTASCSVSPTSAITKQSVTWTAAPSGGIGSYSYSWSGTDGLSGNTQSVSWSYTSSGSKNASVTVTSGSQTYPTACSNSVTVYQPTLVIVPPTATVQADGGTVQLNALYDPDGPGGPSGEQTVTNSSNWSSSNPTKASVNSTGLVTGNTPGSATISASYTDGYNNTIIATASITVTALPPLYCSPSSQNVLIGQAALLSASGGTGNYNWSAPGGSPSAGSGSNFSTSYSSSGTKTVTVSSGSQNAPCSVTVSAPLSADLTPNDSSGLSPLTVNFIGTRIGGNDSQSTWYTFWWNCDNADTTYSGTRAACGDPGNSTIGREMSSGAGVNSVATFHTYSTGTYRPKLLASQGGPTSPGAIDLANVTVSAPLLPDLAIASYDHAPSPTVAGDSMSFSAVVRNNGPGSASNSQTRFRIDIGNNGWSAGEPESTVSTGPLPNPNDAEVINWSAFWTAQAGTHSYEMCADIGGAVPESNEGNNCASRTFTVSAALPQCSDGADNDGDGKIDYPEDLGCSSSLDTDELNACTDGIDNDLDTKIDYKTAPNAFPPGSGDPGCSSLQDTSELDPPTFCEIPPDDPNATCP